MSRLAFLFLLCCIVLPARGAEVLRDGDIIFQTSRSGQSLAIQRATHSTFSHVGLVFFRNGKPFVLEAIATVRYTPLAHWAERGEGGGAQMARRGVGLCSLSSAVGRLLRAE